MSQFLQRSLLFFLILIILLPTLAEAQRLYYVSGSFWRDPKAEYLLQCKNSHREKFKVDVAVMDNPGRKNVARFSSSFPGNKKLRTNMTGRLRKLPSGATRIELRVKSAKGIGTKASPWRRLRCSLVGRKDGREFEIPIVKGFVPTPTPSPTIAASPTPISTIPPPPSPYVAPSVGVPFNTAGACVTRRDLQSTCETTTVSQCSAELKSLCCSCEESWRERFAICGNNPPFPQTAQFTQSARLDPSTLNEALVTGEPHRGALDLEPRVCTDVSSEFNSKVSATVVNQGLTPLQVNLVLFREEGRTERKVVVRPFERRDLSLRSLGFSCEERGVLCVETDSAQPGGWFGGITSDGAYGRLYRPFANPVSEVSVVPVRDEIRITGDRVRMKNTLTIIDGESGDGVGLSGTLAAFNADGRELGRRQIELLDGARFDLATAELMNKVQFGVIRFTPDSGSRYNLAVSRYLDREELPVAALAIPGNQVSGLVAKGSLVGGRGALHTTEVALDPEKPQQIVRSRFTSEGKLLRSGTVQVKAGAILPSSGEGTLRLSAGEYLASEVVYHLSEQGEIVSAYAVPAVSSDNAVQFTLFTTEDSHTNSIQVSNTNSVSVVVTVNALSSRGEAVASEEFELGANGGRAVVLKLPENIRGTILLQGSAGGTPIAGLTIRNVISRGNVPRIVVGGE